MFDAVVVLLVLGAFALGAWKGFAWQIAGILSLLAGFVVAIPLSKVLAPLFGASAPLNRFIALAVVYALVSLGLYLLAFLYRKAISRWELDKWDNHLGAVFGGLKGYLLCTTLVFFALTLFRGLREPILTTRLGNLMGRTMLAVHPVWPPEVHDIIHPYIHHLDPPQPAPAPAPGPGPSPKKEAEHRH